MTEKARFTHTCRLQTVPFLFPWLFIVWFCHFYPVSVLSTGILNLFYSSSFLKLFWLVKLPHNTVSQKTGHRLEYVFTTWKHVAFWYKDQLRLKKLTLQLQCQLIHRHSTSCQNLSKNTVRLTNFETQIHLKLCWIHLGITDNILHFVDAKCIKCAQIWQVHKVTLNFLNQTA